MQYTKLKLQTALVAALLTLAGALPASAQVAAAGEERMFSGGDRVTARVFNPAATFSSDEAVLIWEGNISGIARQRVDAVGERRGERVGLAGNDLPLDWPYEGPATLQRDPSVVALEQNRIVSVWVEEVQQVKLDLFYFESDVVDSRIVARRFNRQARPIGRLFAIGDSSLGLESDPDTVRLSNGRVAVVWQTFQGEEPVGVYGRILNGRGMPLGDVFRVDDSAGGGFRPAVAEAPNAGFVVAWQACCDQGGDDGVFVRSFDADGVPLAAGTQVNAAAEGKQVWPALARGEDGGYFAAWMSPGPPESGLSYQVVGRPLDAAGAPVGAQMTLSGGGGSAHGAPALAAAADGYLLAWTRWHGSFVSSVHATGLTAAGAPLGEADRISDRKVGTQWEIALASDGAGHFLAAWHGFDDDGNPSINVRPLALSGSGTSSSGSRSATMVENHQ